MGFLSAIGKIGAGIAAPFTGGASLAAIPILDSIGKTTSGAASGAAEGRRADSLAQVGAQNANLNTQQLNDRRAILASLLGGVQDAQIGRPDGSTIPTFAISGGLRPSALTNKDALIQQLNSQIKPLDLPKPGALENILGGVGMGSNILGGVLGGIEKAKMARTPPFMPDQASAMPEDIFRYGGLG